MTTDVTDGDQALLAVRLWDGDILLHPAETPGGWRFRPLNPPFFLVHQLDAYLDWMERRGA